MSLRIGPLNLPHSVVTAPLAGITDSPFRRILRRYTQGLIETEQFSAHALVYEDKKTRSMLRSLLGEEGPLSVQIFGGNEQVMRYAASYVKETYAPAVIDINMGCPDRRVMSSGGGAALLGRMDEAVRIAATVVETAAPIPVTAKLRSGLERERIVAPELARQLEGVGIAAVTIHPRTARARYDGPADLNVVRKLKSGLTRIPVIASGCVAELEDIPRVMEETKIDGIMLGRPLLGRPWFLSQAIEIFEGRSPSEVTALRKPDSLRELFALMIDHARLSESLLGQEKGGREVRKHLAWYVKGFPDAARLRHALVNSRCSEEVEGLLKSFLEGHSFD